VSWEGIFTRNASVNAKLIRIWRTPWLKGLEISRVPLGVRVPQVGNCLNRRYQNDKILPCSLMISLKFSFADAADFFNFFFFFSSSITSGSDDFSLCSGVLKYFKVENFVRRSNILLELHYMCQFHQRFTRAFLVALRSFSQLTVWLCNFFRIEYRHINCS